MQPWLPLFCLFLCWPSGAKAQDESELPFMEYLDPGRLVTLKWGFDESKGNITFTLSINTTGWVSFGFSPNGGMRGSDIVIGGVGPSGPYFTDRHATGNSLPTVDKEQSYTLLSLKEADGQTTMSFRRSIQSCDNEDFNITPEPIKLIYAYGITDDIKYHSTRRGTKEVNLLKYMPESTLPGTSYINFTMDNVTIPSRHTHYHCRVMKLPKLNNTHHVYRIEPLIDNVDHVHHILLYGCPPFVTEDYVGPCFSGNIGDHCFRVTAAWGVGAGAFELPENAGIPIGGENSEKFYRLEIHYNNPAKIEGRTDSSGLRMYYTAQLRPHNVGVLTTGVMIKDKISYKIPPNIKQFQAYGMCNTSLFSNLINSSVPDLQAFAVLLHTHLAGRRVRAGLFRNGEQVDFLGFDENYNFEIQQMMNLGKLKTIKPGDDIVVECTYNTMNRTTFTEMGLSTTDEMCLAFILYYPAIDINSCWSHPDTTGLNVTTLLDNNDLIEYENSLKDASQIQVVNNVNSQYALNHKGVMRNIGETPTYSCRNGNAPPSSNNRAARTPSMSWLVILAGRALLLLLLK